jgi:cold-inducible RNA-binding protein
MGTKLFIGSLSWGVTNDTLKEIFSKAGNVLSANVITDRNTGRSKGFGFVEMETPEEAQAAINMFNEQEINGRKVVVSEAKPKDRD